MITLVQAKDLKGIKILDVIQFENFDRDRPDFNNKYLKILYFFRWEGIVNTMRKYHAHKNRQVRYLTFLIIEFNCKKYVNISTQSQKNADVFVINNEFYLYPNIDFKNISNSLDYYLSQFNQYGGNENYELFNIDITHSISLELVKETFNDIYETGLFIYGLGGYVRMFIIHHFKKTAKIACIDYKAEIAEDFKTKYDFKYSFITPDDSLTLLKNTKQPIAIIATYHSDHASIAYKIFNSNPNTFIFIEKPPVVSLEDLEKLIELYNKKANIEIGFNRRFINYSQYVRHKVQNKIIIITCSIKEVIISPSHWYLWKNQGTRITGNVVHWFDLANYWIESIPIEINLLSNPNNQETSTISVLYKNGSILNITASDQGNSLRGVQEKIEVRFDNETIFIDDFLSLTHIKNNGIKVKYSRLFREKGHNEMYDNFNKIVQSQQSSDYSVSDLIKTSIVTFYASTMLKNNIRNMLIENVVNKYLDRVQKH